MEATEHLPDRPYPPERPAGAEGGNLVGFLGVTDQNRKIVDFGRAQFATQAALRDEPLHRHRRFEPLDPAGRLEHRRVFPDIRINRRMPRLPIGAIECRGNLGSEPVQDMIERLIIAQCGGTLAELFQEPCAGRAWGGMDEH